MLKLSFSKYSDSQSQLTAVEFYSLAFVNMLMSIFMMAGLVLIGNLVSFPPKLSMYVGIVSVIALIIFQVFSSDTKLSHARLIHYWQAFGFGFMLHAATLKFSSNVVLAALGVTLIMFGVILLLFYYVPNIFRILSNKTAMFVILVWLAIILLVLIFVPVVTLKPIFMVFAICAFIVVLCSNIVQAMEKEHTPLNALRVSNEMIVTLLNLFLWNARLLDRK